MKETTDFKNALAVLARERRSDDHLEIDELAALAAGELGKDDQERMRDHMVVCPDCFTAYQEFEAFTRPREDDSGEDVSEFEIAAFWRTLRPRLGKTPAWGRWRATALAAAILAALIGASMWTVRQRQLLDSLSAPQPNAPIYDLAADESQRSGIPAVPLEIPENTGFTLVFAPDRTEGFSDFEARILRLGESEPQEVAAVSGLEPDPRDASFTLGLPAGFLAAGDYVLELYGLGEAARLIEDYRIRITGGG